MKTLFKISKIINIIALIFIIFGPFGWMVTGALQLVAAILFVIVFPKNKLIYAYFFVVILYFLGLNQYGYMLSKIITILIPAFLVIMLTYIIYKQKL